MTKNWVKYYIFLGSIVMIVVSFLCSIDFVQTNIKQAQEKKVFESIYTDTTIDFIVPSPSYAQVDEIEQNSETGIASFTPYYETSSSAKINGNKAKGTVLFLVDKSKVDYTPYGTERIVFGEREAKEGDAIVDRVYAKNNNCNIGDKVDMSLAGHSFSFTITGMTEANTYYDGTVALILSTDQVSRLKEVGVGYSAAYVSASDYEKCKKYLYNEYKPYGRLKDESEFDSQETYRQHVQNFNDANWSKEITNYKDNYSSLSVKYENVESGIYRNVIIAVVIVFLTVIIFNVVLVKSEGLKNFFQMFLIKKGGTKAEIKSFYSNGIVFNVVVFFLVTAGLYYWIITSMGGVLIGSNMITSCALIAGQMVASLIMKTISGGYVEKHYTVKKKTENATQAEIESDDAK